MTIFGSGFTQSTHTWKEWKSLFGKEMEEEPTDVKVSQFV